MADQQPIISIDHVSMRFNLAKEKHESLKEYFVALMHGGVRFDEFFALDDVSFDIMPGDFYGLIGLNGSGGGYYDRFLAHAKGNRLLLCPSALVLPEVPADDWDVRFAPEEILTEKGTLL